RAATLARSASAGEPRAISSTAAPSLASRASVPLASRTASRKKALTILLITRHGQFIAAFVLRMAVVAEDGVVADVVRRGQGVELAPQVVVLHRHQFAFFAPLPTVALPLGEPLAQPLADVL